MKYLILTKDGNAFFTNWYSEEMYVEGMTIFSINTGRFTTDGVNWKDIERDFL